MSPRLTGKTEKLIHTSGNTRDIIVCSSINECNLIFQKANHLNLNIPYPMTYESFIDRKFEGKDISGFLIDNLDNLLRFIAQEVPIRTITMNIPIKLNFETANNINGVLDLDKVNFSKKDIEELKSKFTNTSRTWEKPILEVERLKHTKTDLKKAFIQACNLTAGKLDSDEYDFDRLFSDYYHGVSSS